MKIYPFICIGIVIVLLSGCIGTQPEMKDLPVIVDFESYKVKLVYFDNEGEQQEFVMFLKDLPTGTYHIINVEKNENISFPEDLNFVYLGPDIN